VFWCNSRRNHANRQSKTSWRVLKTLGRPWMKIQKVSEHITKGGIMFPSPMTSYMEANTHKDEETSVYAHKHTLMHLQHNARRLECVPCTMRIAHVPWADKNVLCALGMLGEGQNCFFHFFSGKSPVFLLKPSWKFAYK